MESVIGTARARDGCAIAYRIYPQPGKQRLVFIHSLALSGSIWNELVAELRNEMEILVYDCRGHGQSGKRPGPYSVQLFAGDLAALLDHCGWKSALVAGCSMGGNVAQAFAAAYPKRADALALIDTTAWYGATAPQDWRTRASKAAQDGFGSMIEAQLGRWFSDGFRQTHAEIIERVSCDFLANHIACYQASCAMLGECDLRDAVRAFQMPVSIIVGEEDYATPLKMSQDLQGLIPASTLDVISGGRHLTPLQCPQRVADCLRVLAKRITNQGQPAYSVR